MSFDVDLMKGECAHCGRGRESVYEFNLTHNVNEIVERCIAAADRVLGTKTFGKIEGAAYRDRSWGRLNGWSAVDVIDVLEYALREMCSPARYDELRKLEPENGWGTLAITQEVLRKFLAACKEHRFATIETNG